MTSTCSFQSLSTMQIFLKSILGDFLYSRCCGTKNPANCDYPAFSCAISRLHNGIFYIWGDSQALNQGILMCNTSWQTTLTKLPRQQVQYLAFVDPTTLKLLF